MDEQQVSNLIGIGSVIGCLVVGAILVLYYRRFGWTGTPDNSTGASQANPDSTRPAICPYCRFEVSPAVLHRGQRIICPSCQGQFVAQNWLPAYLKSLGLGVVVALGLYFLFRILFQTIDF